MSSKDLLVVRLLDTVRERELEVWCHELLDVRALDVVALLELNDLQDLCLLLDLSIDNSA